MNRSVETPEAPGSAALTNDERETLKRATQWLFDHCEELADDIVEWVGVPSVSRADRARDGAPYGEEVARMFDVAAARASEFHFIAEDHGGHAISIRHGEADVEIGLISHLDVVPEGEGWTFPAFAATRLGDYLVGRGVADNKGPAVGDLYLLRLLRDLRVPLRHSLRVVYGGAEETTMSDMDYYVAHGPIPLVSLVTDGPFPVNYAQKGLLRIRLEVPVGAGISEFSAGTAVNAVPALAEIILRDLPSETVAAAVVAYEALQPEDAPMRGRIDVKPAGGGVRLRASGIAGHAAYPEGTISAIAMLSGFLAASELLSGSDHRAMLAIERLSRSPFGEPIGIDWADQEFGALTVNVGVIRLVGEKLFVTLDIRYPPTVRADHVLDALRSRAAEWSAELVQLQDAPPFELRLTDPRVVLLQDTYQLVTGNDAAPYAMGGGTHSRILPQGITFGPGPPRGQGMVPAFLPAGHGSAHGPDEYLHLPSLFKALRVYLLAILRLDRLEEAGSSQGAFGRF